MKELLKLLTSSEYCVAFTGAGVSTLSGIKDFRGKNGFYNNPDIDPDKIFDLDYFMEDPSYFYTHAGDFIYGAADIEPGIVHVELARLGAMGIVKAVITQNIDMLHQKAGSGNVIEVHGSPSTHKCLSCGLEYSFQWIREKLSSKTVPSCKACGGTVKPGIIFFGENLDQLALQKAVQEASKADLVIVLGSSLVVQPAASIPLYTIENGGKMVIVNDMSTPLDKYATLKYSSLEETFKFIRENLDVA